jgi:hypothetical protein
MFGAVQILQSSLHSHHMHLSGVVPVPAKNSDFICDIWLNCSHWIHKTPDHRLVKILITGLFVWCALVMLCCAWGCNWFCLIHAKRFQYHVNVGMPVDMNCAEIAIALDIHIKIDGHGAKVVHLASSLYLLLDIGNQVSGSKYEQIVNI